MQVNFTGKMRWQQFAAEFGGRYAVMKIGGRVKCLIKIGKDKNPEEVLIAANFSKKEAEKISKDIINNYIVIKEHS